MTWKHRGIPYQRSTGNWLEINTVDQQPFSADPLASGTAILIRDNRGLLAGDGIKLASRNGVFLGTIDAAGAGRGGIQLVQPDADGRCIITLLSGDGLSDNEDIVLSGIEGLGVRGDIHLLSGEIGSGDPSGVIEVFAQDSAILAPGQGEVTITANQGGITVRDYFSIVAANDYTPDTAGLDLGSAGANLFGNGVTIDGSDTNPSYFDGYAGGLTIQSTGGAVTLIDLPQTPGAIAPPANFSGTITINGVEVPYY